jgi:hypothetical protein
MVAGAVILVSALAGRAEADHVEPDLVDGNPTCGDVTPAGEEWISFKLEGPQSGTFTDGTLEVTVEITGTDDGQVFDWTSNIGVDAVIVKGGPNANVYFYDPEDTSDTGLHAPLNETNNMFFGLSHIDFCYDVEDEETTTTTEEETTTTTEEETTTTTEEETTTTTEEETTTTAPEEETTTTAPEEETTTTTAAPMEELPRTGSSSGPMVGLGAGLLAIGAGLDGATRLLRRPA